MQTYNKESTLNPLSIDMESDRVVSTYDVFGEGGPWITKHNLKESKVPGGIIHPVFTPEIQDTNPEVLTWVLYTSIPKYKRVVKRKK